MKRAAFDHTPRPPRARDARILELIEALSASSQHRCAPPEVKRKLGLFDAERGSARLVLTRGSTNLIYNRLVGLGQRTPARIADVDWALAHAREHRAAGLAVAMTPRSRPGKLSSWLARRGFGPGFPGAKLWRDGSPLGRARPAGAKIRVRALRPSEASVWVDVVSQVWRTFGSRRPWFEARARETGWRHYVAFVDERPVGAAALFVGDVASRRAGHLVDGVTLSPARRLGVQSALIRRRVRDGLRAGCTLFCSETAPPLPRMPLVSYRNLRRQGFQLAYLRDSWNLRLR